MTWARNYISLALVLLLAACAQAPLKTLRELPPSGLAANCDAPVTRVATNGQMAETLLAYKHALAMCNNDKAALREWMEK